MITRLIRTCVAVCLLAALWLAPSGVLANPSVECAQLAWYAGQLKAFGEQIDAAEASGPDMEHVETWSAADFDTALAIYDRMLTVIRDVNPPQSAAEFHQTFIEGIALLREAIATMQTVGMFAILAYLQPIAAIDQQLFDLSLPLEATCQVAIFDHDQDGVLEVGLGTAPASPGAGWSEFPGASTGDGSRTGPIAVGTAALLDGQREQTALSVTKVATAEVVADDPSNTALADGVQQPKARVKVTNTGVEDDSFFNWRLLLMDPSDRASAPFIDAYGFVPDERSPDTFAPGESAKGNVPWASSSAKATSTAASLMYDKDAFEGERVYFSL